MLEQVKLAVMAAIGTDGKVNIETLSNELEKIDGVDRGSITLPTEIEIKGQKVSIEEDGTVTLQGGSGEKVTIADLISSGQAVTTNTTLEDANGDSITIPANFNLSSESPELVTEGMIIEDSEDNQYVWIPIFEKSDDRTWGVDYTSVKLQTEDTEEYYKAIETALKKYTTMYKSDKHIDEWYGDEEVIYGYYNDEGEKIYYSNGNMTEEEYNTLYCNMLKSVYINGGFYIGRYEMGIKVVNSSSEAQNIVRTSMKEYISTYDSENNTAPSIEGMTSPISKANAVGYTNITQQQAQMLAEKLEEASDYENVTSSLIFGVQWDIVCVFIEHYDNNNTATTKSQWLTNNTYSKTWCNYYNATFTMNRGYYTTNVEEGRDNPVIWNNADAKESSGNWICTTGASDQNSSLNIYDFGGNLSEFTLETSSSDSSFQYVHRGGHANNDAYSFYASYRYKGNTFYGSANYFTSARVSLFM